MYNRYPFHKNKDGILPFRFYIFLVFAMQSNVSINLSKFIEVINKESGIIHAAHPGLKNCFDISTRPKS